MFIGREVEMERLRRMYDSPNQEVVLIYGRRRIGKSELIKQFLKTSKIQGLYYQCKRTTEMNNVQSLSALISEVYQYPPLAFTGMEKLLDFLFQRACRTRQVLVLDEYPYLRQTVPGLDSILQSLIDSYRERSQLKLLVGGARHHIANEQRIRVANSGVLNGEERSFTQADYARDFQLANAEAIGAGKLVARHVSGR